LRLNAILYDVIKRHLHGWNFSAEIIFRDANRTAIHQELKRPWSRAIHGIAAHVRARTSIEDC
jgi:hypothetical protein